MAAQGTAMTPAAPRTCVWPAPSPTSRPSSCTTSRAAPIASVSVYARVFMSCHPAFLYHCSEFLTESVENADNLTEALLFLSHFMGDIHQPMHVGFTSDMGGNSVNLRWFKHKSNLHHVWDREIILTVLAERYAKDMAAFRKDLQHNITKGSWSDESSWKDCADLMSCPTKYATESIGLACKWGYDGVHDGDTLSEDYFGSRLPIVTRRIAQGGVRLAMFLNRAFGDHKAHGRDVAAQANLVVAHDDEL
ncbi:hypothetical protein VPH35_032367 [Triticum aestivum]